jgi:hypothetical protein
MPAKKKVVYRSKRHIDKLSPGDLLPDGAYTEDHILRMLNLGMIEVATAEEAEAKVEKE